MKITEEEEQEIIEHIDAGKKVNAIKTLRNATHWGLKESKAEIDFFDKHGKWLTVEVVRSKTEPIGWRDNPFPCEKYNGENTIYVGLPQSANTRKVRERGELYLVLREGKHSAGIVVIRSREQLNKLANTILMAYDYIEE